MSSTDNYNKHISLAQTSLGCCQQADLVPWPTYGLGLGQFIAENYKLINNLI